MHFFHYIVQLHSTVTTNDGRSWNEVEWMQCMLLDKQRVGGNCKCGLIRNAKSWKSLAELCGCQRIACVGTVQFEPAFNLNQLQYSKLNSSCS